MPKSNKKTSNSSGGSRIKRNPQPEEPTPEESEQEDEVMDVEPGVDEEENGSGQDEALTEDNAARAEKMALRKRNALWRGRKVAKTKGYRVLATKSGLSSTVASSAASRDVAGHLLSVKEAMRAAKWTPAIADKAAYSSTEEFEKRLSIASEPLPMAPAAVLRDAAEVFARKIMEDAMYRTVENGSVRISVATVAAVLRPLQPAMELSFLAPHGLVRHGQTTMANTTPIGKTARTIRERREQAPALGSLAGDDAQIDYEAKVVIPRQVEVHKAVAKAAAQRKKTRQTAKAAKIAAPAVISKKKKMLKGVADA